MTLQHINSSRLQKTVADLEFANNYSDFNALCKAVSETEWAKGFSLTQESISDLIYARGTITKVDKPVKETKPEPVATAAPAVVDGTDEAKVVKTYDGPAKGRKQCPACQSYVGGRSAFCHCGHEFGKKVKAPVVEDTTSDDDVEIERERPSEEYGHGYRSKTWVPAGDCPVKLRSLDRDAIQEWAEAVRRSFENRHRSFLTLHGLQYWVKEFYPPFKSGPIPPGADGNNPDYLKALEVLQEIYHEDYLHEKGR